MQRNPVTPAGYEALVRDLRRQKEVVRPQIVRDIEEARAHGDISENSEYEDAKERQAHCEGRIAQLENLVATADIIDVHRLPRNGRVVFGTTVLLESRSSGSRTWRIVGETEVDVAAGLISYKSPLARALIGRSEGEEVEVPAPGGIQRGEISEVRYE
jgi:transcription elongation factor GreA